jgi:glyoxylase-like metal-dependent hydrolase (beta-lactamase superfamily II)
VNVWHHTDFKFHRRITQIGCYWGGGGHTELYLFEGDALVLIDTGVADTPTEYVEPALRSIGRALKEVDVVLNTHGHHDHAGGNHAVWRAAKCEVWIHEADARIATDAEHQFELFFARNQRLVGREDQLEAARQAHASTAGGSAPVTRTLRDGELLDLGRGIELRVVHTPGHTLGCCTFFWEREGIAISGDSALGRGSREGGMPLIFYPDLYRASLEKVRQLAPGTLCLGHHYRTLRQTSESIRYGDLVGAFLDESGEIAGIIEDATARAVADLGKDAPFERIARRALGSVATRMPLGNDGGAEWPNGAIAPISAFWAAMTGQAV